jgi:hypothetical protein
LHRVFLCAKIKKKISDDSIPAILLEPITFSDDDIHDIELSNLSSETDEVPHLHRPSVHKPHSVMRKINFGDAGPSVLSDNNYINTEI